MIQELYRVYFEDECPAIGAGWRLVMAKIGYKWVHVKTPGAGRGTRISRKMWDKLRKQCYETKTQKSGS